MHNSTQHTATFFVNEKQQPAQSDVKKVARGVMRLDAPGKLAGESAAFAMACQTAFAARASQYTLQAMSKMHSLSRFSPVDERASLIKQRGAILAFSNFQVPKKHESCAA
jgi:FKBP-type peptidyl-prolyl cis-trans isomerase 2